MREDFKKRLIRLSVTTIHFCKKLADQPVLWSISDQLVRSVTSVGANAVEAQGCGSKKDFIRFFEISLKSAHESKYWLEVLKEYKPEIEKDILPIFKELEEISKIIASSILTAKRNLK